MNTTTRALPALLSAFLLWLTPVAASADGAQTARASGPAAAAAAELPSGREVMDRFLEAIGGRKKLEAIESLAMTQVVDMKAQGLKATVESHVKAPDSFLQRMTMPPLGTFEQGFDGSVGWSRDPLQGARLMSAKEIELVRMGLPGRSADADQYATLETLGRETFAGHDAYRVRMVTKDGGFESIGFFDVETGLQVGAEMKAPTPMGELPATFVFEEYRDEDGLKFPSRVTSKAAFATMVMTLQSLELNVEELPSFVPPPEVRELAKSSASSADESDASEAKQ